jgi:hypothetical protein
MESDAANQEESNALFFKILPIFLGGGQIFEVPDPIFLKLRNWLIEISSLGSSIHVWMVFEGTRCLCQPPKFGH